MYVNAMSIKNHVHFPYKYISELYSFVSVCAFVKDTRLKFGIYLKFTIAESLKYRCIYVYMYIYTLFITGHKSSTTRRVLKSHRSKMGVIYMQS